MDVKRPRPWQQADSQGDQPAPAEVPTVAKQAGEAEPPRARRVRWSWVETSVWTDRMLTAFEQGVKGGDKRLFQRVRPVFPDQGPSTRVSVPEGGPLTGEPDAVNPHVRFGGRGVRNKSGLSYLYVRWRVCEVKEMKVLLEPMFRLVVEGNRVAARQGGKQPETNHQTAGYELDSA